MELVKYIDGENAFKRWNLDEQSCSNESNFENRVGHLWSVRNFFHFDLFHINYFLHSQSSSPSSFMAMIAMISRCHLAAMRNGLIFVGAIVCLRSALVWAVNITTDAKYTPQTRQIDFLVLIAEMDSIDCTVLVNTHWIVFAAFARNSYILIKKLSKTLMTFLRHKDPVTQLFHNYSEW